MKAFQNILVLFFSIVSYHVIGQDIPLPKALESLVFFKTELLQTDSDYSNFGVHSKEPSAQSLLIEGYANQDASRFQMDLDHLYIFQHKSHRYFRDTQHFQCGPLKDGTHLEVDGKAAVLGRLFDYTINTLLLDRLFCKN